MINGYRRFEKIRLTVAAGAFLCAIALLVCYAAVFTTASYKNEIKGYTNFEISSFHAILLGDMTESDVTDTWSDQSKSIVLFGENISTSNLLPGMGAKTIPFALANGTSPENISGMDFDFSLRLRTTGNIPLAFTLVWKEKIETKNEGGEVISVSEKEHKFLTNGKYYLEEDIHGDAPKYIYTFYEQLGEAGETYLDESEYQFYMSGGELELESFELQIEWPVTTDEFGDSTNSTKYMKEVDVIDMMAVITSKNRSETYTGSSGIPSYDSEGMINVYAGGGDYGNGTSGESFVYSFNFRAFVVQSSAVKGDTSEYTFVVGNGNNLYKNGSLQHPSDKKYTNFKIEFALPLSVDTMSRSDSIRSTAIFVQDKADADGDGDVDEFVEITSTSITYRLYDMTDDTYQTFKTRQQALDYITDAEYDYIKSNLRMYKIITPIFDEYNPYQYTMNNTEANGERQYDSLSFKIMMFGEKFDRTSSNPTIATAMENIPRIIVTAYYQDAKPEYNGKPDSEIGSGSIDSSSINSGAIDSSAINSSAVSSSAIDPGAINP